MAQPHIWLIASYTRLRAAMARALMAAGYGVEVAENLRRAREAAADAASPRDRGARMRVHAVMSDAVAAGTPHALPDDAAPDRRSNRAGRGDRPRRYRSTLEDSRASHSLTSGVRTQRPAYLRQPGSRVI